MSDTEGAITRTEIGAVSHAGEPIVKADRSIRAQESSVVRRANVDIVPAQKNDWCVSAKRGSAGFTEAP